MGKSSKTLAKIQDVLTERLDLDDPVFQLEKLPNGKYSGSIISDSFVKMSDLERQRAIWSALDNEFGDDSTTHVGTLLAYTKKEWDIPLEGSAQPKRKTRSK